MSRLHATSIAFTLACLILGLAGCRATGSPIEDGRYELRADRRYQKGCGSIRYPHDPIPDSCFEKLRSPEKYAIVISRKGSRVEIVGSKGIPISGSLSQWRADGAVFVLKKGIPAGGQLRVSGANGKDRTAQLTLFGSGLPVLSSERGRLVKGK